MIQAIWWKRLPSAGREPHETHSSPMAMMKHCPLLSSTASRVKHFVIQKDEMSKYNCSPLGPLLCLLKSPRLRCSASSPGLHWMGYHWPAKKRQEAPLRRDLGGRHRKRGERGKQELERNRRGIFGDKLSWGLGLGKSGVSTFLVGFTLWSMVVTCL